MLFVFLFSLFHLTKSALTYLHQLTNPFACPQLFMGSLLFAPSHIIIWLSLPIQTYELYPVGSDGHTKITRHLLPFHSSTKLMTTLCVKVEHFLRCSERLKGRISPRDVADAKCQRVTSWNQRGWIVRHKTWELHCEKSPTLPLRACELSNRRNLTRHCHQRTVEMPSCGVRDGR